MPRAGRAGIDSATVSSGIFTKSSGRRSPLIGQLVVRRGVTGGGGRTFSGSGPVLGCFVAERSYDQAGGETGEACCHDQWMCEGEQRQRGEGGEPDIQGEFTHGLWQSEAGVDGACRLVLGAIVHGRGDALVVGVPDDWIWRAPPRVYNSCTFRDRARDQRDLVNSMGIYYTDVCALTVFNTR